MEKQFKALVTSVKKSKQVKFVEHSIYDKDAMLIITDRKSVKVGKIAKDTIKDFDLTIEVVNDDITRVIFNERKSADAFNDVSEAVIE
ncbi:hypothetical protein HYO65_gp189 [Tenacibaculum phage PTm1]|uniref:Uncharacterized protein n=2 Tax=Shirahamavirus PTm1 TaxID=2846435 RepID=A0A5S9HXM2_9CAUD|nr:hypothetical protein HYO65_gp189 [Tenacibaculum phage PTm1]BBI90581.1 hypothetical protein [Tenacibaculum phage PTm1]BBI90889.1 hypothetical protein [Tenacibaculum phage PTm5]